MSARARRPAPRICQTICHAIFAVIFAATLATAAGCPDPLPIDEHLFACRTHAECGEGAFCADGVCRLFGAPLEDVSPDVETPDASPPELEVAGACSAPLVASRYGDRASFVILVDPSTGQKLLRVRVDDLETLVPLDEDVVGFAEDEGAASCCEDPCCTLLGAPPGP